MLKNLLLLLTGLILFSDFYSQELDSTEFKLMVDKHYCISTPTIPSDTITDIEGNTYKIVKIGNQTWMAENLRTTKYNNGTSIPNVTNNKEWSKLKTGAFCWYNNNISNKNKYGALYNWHAVETGNLCPMGWHVPNDIEWKELEIFLGMTKNEADDTGSRGNPIGNKLKNTSGWAFYKDENYGNNESGFNALPSGFRRDFNGQFNSIRGICQLWTSTLNESIYSYNDSTLQGVTNSVLDESIHPWCRYLVYSSGKINRCDNDRNTGNSVRCIKD